MESGYKDVYRKAAEEWLKVDKGDDTERSLDTFFLAIEKVLHVRIKFDRAFMDVIKECQKNCNDRQRLMAVLKFATKLLQIGAVPKKQGVFLIHSLKEQLNTQISEDIKINGNGGEINIDKHLIEIVNLKSLQKSPAHQNIILTTLQYFSGMIHKFNRHLKVQPFGSCVNGFAMTDCDLDINVAIKCNHQKQLVDTVYALKRHIQRDMDYMQYQSISTIVNEKFKMLEFRCLSNGLEIDIVINGLGSRNSQLLRQYSQIREFIAQSGILLKLWGKKHSFIKKFKVTSYSLIIMFIHYLIKTGCLKPLKIFQNGSFYVGGCEKQSTIYQCLCGFFQFYLEFDKSHMVSLTEQTTVKNQEGIILNIADPFELKNLGRIQRYEAMSLFFTPFRNALEILKRRNKQQIAAMFIN